MNRAGRPATDETVDQALDALRAAHGCDTRVAAGILSGVARSSGTALYAVAEDVVSAVAGNDPSAPPEAIRAAVTCALRRILTRGRRDGDRDDAPRTPPGPRAQPNSLAQPGPWGRPGPWAQHGPRAPQGPWPQQEPGPWGPPGPPAPPNPLTPPDASGPAGPFGAPGPLAAAGLGGTTGLGGAAGLGGT